MVSRITVTHQSNHVRNIQVRFKEIGNETRLIKSLDNIARKMIDDDVINVIFKCQEYPYYSTKRHVKLLSQLTYYDYQNFFDYIIQNKIAIGVIKV